MVAEVRRVADREEWEGVLASFPGAPVQQGWRWGDFRSRPGLRSVRVVAEVDSCAVAACQFVHRFPGLLWAAGGPVVRHPLSDLDTVRSALESLVRSAGRRTAVVLVAPHLSAESWDGMTGGRPHWRHLPSVSSMASTTVVDVSSGIEEIRGSCHSKWRYELRKAEAEDLETLVLPGVEGVERMWPLYAELSHAKRFERAFSLRDLRRLAGSYDDHCVCLLAAQNGVDCAGAMVLIRGDTALFLIGASNDTGRRTSAAYLIQWEAVQAIKQMGVQYYDLGGLDRTRNPGVARFKERMGGRPTELPGVTAHATGRLGRLLLRLLESRSGDRVGRRRDGRA